MPQHAPLRNRVAIITGASAGIGEATARRLASLGAHVVVNARRSEKLHALASTINSAAANDDAHGQAVVVPGDCVEPETIAALFDAATREFGKAADLVVVNAGRGLRGSPLGSDEAEWESMIRLNLLGASRLIREAGNRLRDDANERKDWPSVPRDIVVLSSNVGKHISPFSSMYGGTKFAITSIAEAVRRELAPAGVRVSAIHPGVVKSEFQESAGYDPKTFGEFMQSIAPVLAPDDVARTISFIVSQPPHVLLNDVTIRCTRQEYP
ncbi:MAG: SDR family oxidoreductase [Phycisphaerales bacterium]